MNITPDDAAQALAQVDETKRRALRAASPIPASYPVAVWILVTGSMFATEVTSGWWLWIAVTALSISLPIAVFTFVRDIRNANMRPHPSLIDPGAMAGYAAWMIGTGFGGVMLALWLKGLDIAYPRTLMGVIMTAIVAATAPLLARWMSRRTAHRAETTNR